MKRSRFIALRPPAWFALIALMTGWPASADAAAKRPVAALQVSAVTVRPGDTITIDAGRSRPSQGARIRRVTISMGDGTRRRTSRKPRTIKHAYRRKGLFDIVVRVLDSRGRSASIRQRITVGDSLARAVPRPKTVVARASDVRSVGPAAHGRQIAILRPGSAPPVGGALVVPVSDERPDGVLGVVTSRGLAGSDVAVTLRPATLDEAYSDLKIDASGSLSDAVVRSQSGTRLTRAELRAFHLGGTGVRCTGLRAAPVNIELDLDPLHWDLSFTAPFPSIHFLLAGSPIIKVGLGLNTGSECHLTLPVHVTIPIAGTPILLKISPVLRLSADGTLNAQFEWRPRLAYGFDRGNGISGEVHVFNPGTQTLNINSTAEASLFFGASANLSLAGRVGVQADFGPAFTFGLAQTASQSCVSADLGLRLSASANADVFVKNWSFALFNGTIAKKQLYRRCNNSGSQGAGSGGTATSPGGGPPGSSPGNVNTPVSYDRVTPLGPTVGPVGYSFAIKGPPCRPPGGAGAKVEVSWGNGTNGAIAEGALVDWTVRLPTSLESRSAVATVTCSASPAGSPPVWQETFLATATGSRRPTKLANAPSQGGIVSIASGATLGDPCPEITGLVPMRTWLFTGISDLPEGGEGGLMVVLPTATAFESKPLPAQARVGDPGRASAWCDYRAASAAPGPDAYPVASFMYAATEYLVGL